MSPQGRRSYLLKVHEPYVMVPARIAALIESRSGIGALRVQVRGLDPEASAVLEDIRLAAMSWRGSATGTVIEAEPEPTTPLREWVTTGGAADLLGITSRAVRKAIARGAIPAQNIDGRYRIDRADIEHYRATRAA